MSADNWTRCPQCIIRADDAKEARKRTSEKAYGVVPEAEYLKLKAEADKEVHVGDTLREDFSVGIKEDGTFYIEYSASCECGFKFKYKRELQIPFDGDTRKFEV